MFPSNPIFKVKGIYPLVDKLKISGKIKILEEIRKRPKYWITTIADPEGNHLQLYEEKTKKMGNDPV